MKRMFKSNRPVTETSCRPWQVIAGHS